MSKAFFIKSRISENISETPEGYLLCLNVPIGRTGEMIYAPGEYPSGLEGDDSGVITAVRDAEDLFSPKTIASFEGKPLTIRHPNDFVTPQNWSSLAKGTIQNIRQGTGENAQDLMCDILVTDQLAIGMIKNGIREVSCGYDAEYVQLEKGRCKQINIIGNHLALVEEGRAGPSYAITDHKQKEKGVSLMKSKFDSVKKLFSKTFDEAEKMLVEDKEEEMKKVEEKKEMKDADPEILAQLLEMLKKLSAKLEPAKDEMPLDKEEKKVEVKKEAKDEMEGSIEERLKALELAVSKMMEAESAESKIISEGEESEEMIEDEMEEEVELTGDTAERLEILVPGMLAKTSDENIVKIEALKSFYSTKDGKDILDRLNGGKAPTFDSAEKVNMLFIASSEVLKNQRTDELSITKRVRSFDSKSEAGFMTAEKMNEINAKRYGI